MNIRMKTMSKIILLPYLLGLLLVLTLAQPLTPATAQATDTSLSPQAALERLFTSDTIEAAWLMD